MNTISIEIQDCFAKSDIFTVSSDYHSASIQHHYNNIKKFKKLDERSITKDDYEKILKAFMDVNFNAVFNENPDLIGADGWTLICSIENGTSRISIAVWCPEKDLSKPETLKLIEACELVCPVLDIEKEAP